MLRDFMRMNSKTTEDPPEFVDKVRKILVAMGPTEIEKGELSSYHLKVAEQT